MRPTADVLQRAIGVHRRRPVLGDVALVGLLLVPVTMHHVGDLQMTPESRAFTIALVLPLLARRRRPTAVFAMICGIALCQWLLDVRAIGDVALLVALYTVAAAGSTRTALLAGLVVEVGVLMAVLGWTGADQFRAFVGLTGLAVAAAVLGTSTRSRHALVASLHERAERLEHERDQQGRLAAAAERSRIAREMHDIVAHNVSVMIALADGATYTVDDEPDRARHAMQAVSQTGRQALTEMRRLLGVLREDDHRAEQLSPQPGMAQIDTLLHQVRTAGLPVGYEVSGPPLATLPPGLQLAIYRIVQEALTNTLKHAGPGARAWLMLRRDSDGVEVEVVDVGGGPTAAANPSAGAGLRGMRERAAVYDGEVQAGPLPDGGWRVRVSVPLAQPAVPA